MVVDRVTLVDSAFLTGDTDTDNKVYNYAHRRIRHLQSGKARMWVWSSCNVCNQLLMGAS